MKLGRQNETRETIKLGGSLYKQGVGRVSFANCGQLVASRACAVASYIRVTFPHDTCSRRALKPKPGSLSGLVLLICVNYEIENENTFQLLTVSQKGSIALQPKSTHT